MSTNQKVLKELLKNPLQDIALNQEPLQTFLRNVQGNILHGHGRNFAAHFFLRFKGVDETTKKAVKNWLHNYITDNSHREGVDEGQVVMSARDQLAERERYSRPEDRKALFVSCLLSLHGYEYLDLPTTKFHEKESLSHMKDRATKLKDISHEAWDENYKEPIDMLIILAHQKGDRLQGEVERLRQQVKIFDPCPLVEYGNVLRENGSPQGRRIVHFGYVEDGASQPLFFQRDLDKEAKRRGIDQWDPSAGPRLVLTKDPLGEKNTDYGYGSYLVFRKLHQNVSLFNTQIKKLAQELKESEDKAAALVVGRYRNGKSLILDTAPSGSLPVIPNNYRYDTDWNGQRCPFYAHMRRMNPRWEVNTAKYDRRIARRSIPYGTLEEAKDDTKDDTKEVGLLFMCYQQSLKDQFEALQGTWAYDPKYFPPSGRDLLIGRKLEPKESSAEKPKWHIAGLPPKAIHDWSDCVTLKGGEYFFAPSLSFLRDLHNRWA